MEVQTYFKKKRQAIRDSNYKTVAEMCRKLATYHNGEGDYERAFEEFKEEKEAYLHLGSSLDAARAERMMGEMQMMLGEYHKALEHEKKYLEVAKEEEDKLEQQRAYATIGRIYLVMGQEEEEPIKRQNDLQLAEKTFIKSLHLSRSLAGTLGRFEVADMEARLYLNLGIVKEYSDDYDEAAQYIDKAIKIARSNDLHDLLHHCYTSGGLMHSSRTGDTTKALQLLNLALQVAERLPDRTVKICETLLAKAEVSLKIGDAQSAKQPLVKAYKMKCPNQTIRDSIESNLKVIVALELTQEKLLNDDSQDYSGQQRLNEKMGDGWCKLGNYKKAIEFYLKMLECAELNGDTGKTLQPIYVSLYQTYKDDEQYDMALRYLWKEHELVKTEPKELVDTLLGIAEVQELSKKGFFETEATYQQARDAAKLAHDTSLERKVVLRWLSLCKKYAMIINEEELRATSSHLDLEDSESQDIVEEVSTAIGDDVNLEDFFPDEEREQRLRMTRKRTGFQIKKNAKGETQLHQACIAGNLTLVQKLLDQGHPTLVRDNAGWLPLHEACNHGYRDIVEELLMRGGTNEINDKGGTACDGITPLYDACCNGNLEIIELLLDQGADPTIRTDSDETPLQAIEKWHQSARLSEAEETMYQTLRRRIRNSLEKTGNLNSSRNSLGRKRSQSITDVESTTSSRASSKSNKSVLSNSSRSTKRDIRHGLDISDDDDNSKNSDNDVENVPKRTRSPPPKKKSAKSDYKEVMNRLRHPHQSNATLLNTSRETNKRKPALVSTAEVPVDDWLDDDLGPSMKKQKFLTDAAYAPVVTKRRSKDGSSESSGRAKIPRSPLPSPSRGNYSPVTTPKASPVRQSRLSLSSLSPSPRHQRIDTINLDKSPFRVSPLYSSSPLIDSTNRELVFDDFLIDDETPIWQTGSHTGGFETRKTTSIQSTRPVEPPKRQSRLTDAGFSRARSPSIEFDSMPDSTTLSAAYDEVLPFANESVGSTSSRRSTIKSIAVKIDTELISVPVKSDEVDKLTVGWLVKEAANRFSSLYGRTPDMQLTLNGALMINSDPLAVVFQPGEIKARVLSWKTISISDRYRTACHELGEPPVDQLVQILQECHVNNRLQLSYQNITAVEFEPISTALKMETNLTVLDLSNNSLKDDGVKRLTSILGTLRELRTLNLSGNFISSQGVNCLKDVVGDLQTLQELRLDYNPLGNYAVANVFTLCAGINSLRGLSLRSCDLNNIDFGEGLANLTSLDLSYNQLSSRTMRQLSICLNKTTLEQLDLSHVSRPGRDDPIDWCHFFNGDVKFVSLSELRLAGNDLTDADVWLLLNALTVPSRTGQVNVLDLSHNPALTTATFDYVVLRDSTSTTIKRILFVGCTKLLSNCGNDLINSTNMNNGNGVILDGDFNQCRHPEYLELTLDKADDEERQRQVDFVTTLWRHWWDGGARNARVHVDNISHLTAFLSTDGIGEGKSDKNNYYYGNGAGTGEV